MSDAAAMQGHGPAGEVTKHDFLKLVTGAAGGSDPRVDSAQVEPNHARRIVLIGIRKHPGCVPLGNKATDVRRDCGGWFRPCHGSQSGHGNQYHTSGRVRHDRSPANLSVRDHAFDTDSKIKIG